MKEIIELNKRLLRDNRKHLPPGGVMLARRDAPEEWRSFHPSHGEEIEDLRSRLNEVLPEDFDYLHCLGDTEPDFSVRYYNGITTCASRGYHWQEAVSIFAS